MKYKTYFFSTHKIKNEWQNYKGGYSKIQFLKEKSIYSRFHRLNYKLRTVFGFRVLSAQMMLLNGV